MDTITHGLTGAVIGYAGFRQRPDGGRLALWTAIAAAEFPDADIFMAVFGGDTYLRWHRSFTHSVLLWPVWAAFVAGIFWAFARRSNYKLLFQAALAGIGSHIFLDWVTSYGTELLWPVTDARFELSWVFIVDFYVWAILLAGLIAAIWTQRVAVARSCLAVLAGFFLFCAGSRAIALRDLPAGAAAYPEPLNPTRWTLVRADGDRIHWMAGGRNDTFTQYHDEVLLPKAELTDAVKTFRWFAAFPLVEKFERDGLTVLRYRDLRFRSPMPWGDGVREGMFIVAKVVFDERGNLLASGLGSDER